MDALKICPEGADVPYYLGKHPEVAKELDSDWKAGKQQVCSRLDYIANGIRFQEGICSARGASHLLRWNRSIG